MQKSIAEKGMLPSLCAILEPPAPAIRTRRDREFFIPPERDAIPVITMRRRTLMVRSVTPSDAPLLADMLAACRCAARSCASSGH